MAIQSLMFSLFFFSLLLLSYSPSFLASAAISKPSSIAIPLNRPTYAHPSGRNAYVHGSIVQQQHINRGLKRLAKMTGQIAPSDHDLLYLLYKRISVLTADEQCEYGLEEIGAVLAHHGFSPASYENRINFGTSNSSNSHNLHDSAIKGARTLETTYSPLHTAGLSIESNDIGYITNMEIGTPPKMFRLLVDSGSADLWVGAIGCRSDTGGGCGNHTFLGQNSSSTYVQSKQDWAIGYVSGSVWGYIVQDRVSVADLTLKNHTFGVAFNESSDFTGNDIPFDGLFGLAKLDVSQQRVPTLLQALRQAKLISYAIASYKIPRLADGKSNIGELTLGAMDPKHFSSKSLVTVKNVNKYGYWGCAVDAVKVGNQNMNWSNRTALMDTGTTLIIAPKSDVDAIHNAIPGALFDGDGWTVPCNMTTVLSLTIGGKAFTVNPHDIAFYPVEQGSQTCMSGIGIGGVGPFDLDTDWLVGDVFLKNVYFSTNEDNDEISVAKPLY